MKRTSGLPVYKPPQLFSQPDGIETAAIDNLTNLVALADPALTHDDEGIAPGRSCETHETRVRPAALSCNPGVAQPPLPVPEPP
jgi:hypothetical protein